ncbi:MAG: ferredoxin [Chloroflexi bacterium]|nr:ferredoxin [Chloroflexota bacterium]
MGHRIRLRVDQSSCVSSSLCVYTAPGVFELDASGRATVVDLHAASMEQIREAAEGCPVSAIILEDADTGEPILPGG